MINRCFLAFLSCVLTGPAFGAKLDVCPTLAAGNWVIESVDPPGEASSLSTWEARAYISKRISVSDKEVIFAGVRCPVIKHSVRYSVGDDFDVPGFPYWVIYGCPDNVAFNAVFHVGRSCDHIVSGVEDWGLQLRRAR